ncbi:TetR/AcrR family transcriptional regulator [Streptomyces sp. NPDC088400]|uniref:TetR/AcrR family transcriptional regulator n=1 Tax=Streptomyces sp. NPDC088400 TaxID=3365861 RepID=UPI0037F35FA4
MIERERATEKPGATKRSDAEQNRARILEIARTALTASSDATMNSIAKRAGVGQGTMYRHFPNREALLLAVYRHDVQALIDAAPELLAQETPFEALRLWFDRLASYARIKHGVAAAVEAATRADLSNEYYDPVIAAITLLLDACKTAGTVRPDVDADEVLLLVSFLWRMENPDWEARSRHLLTLVMDGLRERPDHER